MAKFSKKASESKADVYQQVTDKIIAMLEAGFEPWKASWRTKGGAISRPLRACGIPYQGINVLLLWMEAMDKGYECPIWFTFNQARDAGGMVRKGEKGTTVVFANTFKKVGENDVGEEVIKNIPFMKGYYVFNRQQIDGLPELPKQEAEKPEPIAKRLKRLDKFFSALGITIKHGGSQPFYRPADDFVQMPKYEDFNSRQDYYATLAHEIIHATGSPERTGRPKNAKAFGDADYAAEELVAELGSAFLCADLKITDTVRPDVASYIGAWLKALRNDKRFIFTASSAAQKAVEWCHSKQS